MSSPKSDLLKEEMPALDCQTSFSPAEVGRKHPTKTDSLPSSIYTLEPCLSSCWWPNTPSVSCFPPIWQWRCWTIGSWNFFSGSNWAELEQSRCRGEEATMRKKWEVKLSARAVKEGTEGKGTASDHIRYISTSSKNRNR